jgi:hypothetical protein
MWAAANRNTVQPKTKEAFNAFIIQSANGLEKNYRKSAQTIDNLCRFGHVNAYIAGALQKGKWSILQKHIKALPEIEREAFASDHVDCLVSYWRGKLRTQIVCMIGETTNFDRLRPDQAYMRAHDMAIMYARGVADCLEALAWLRKIRWQEKWKHMAVQKIDEDERNVPLTRLLKRC